MTKRKYTIRKKERIEPNQPDYLGLKNFKADKIDDSEFLRPIPKRDRNGNIID